jgi:hypothetical protein
MERVSLSLGEVRAIKKYATRDASYADRVSLGFAVALAHLGEVLGGEHDVLHEMDVLEGLASNSSTKESTQFKRPPLHPFWHKHFSTARHLMRNMGERWGLGNSGNRDLSAKIEEVAVRRSTGPMAETARASARVGRARRPRRRAAHDRGLDHLRQARRAKLLPRPWNP